MKKSLDVAESSGLCFKTSQDAIDYASKTVKEANDWLIFHNVDFAERYAKQELCLIFNRFVRTSYGVYDLVFVAIPERHLLMVKNLENLTRNKICNSGTNPDRGKHSMFVGVTYLIESPEKVIPSFVWLEITKDRPDVMREIFKDSAIVEISLSGGFPFAQFREGWTGWYTLEYFVRSLIGGETDSLSRLTCWTA